MAFLLPPQPGKKLALFHLTSRYGLDSAKKKGRLGVTSHDYEEYITDILVKMGVPSDKVRAFVKKELKSLEDFAPNGQVSFFQSLEACRKIAFTAKDLGEAFGHTLRRTVIYGSRVLKKKSDYSILDKFFRKNQPVILEVHLNASQVQNPEDYGDSYEITSKQWVPFAEVVRMSMGVTGGQTARQLVSFAGA